VLLLGRLGGLPEIVGHSLIIGERTLRSQQVTLASLGSFALDFMAKLTHAAVGRSRHELARHLP
jgi:hypothetical protein